jgi:hypothetical protein
MVFLMINDIFIIFITLISAYSYLINSARSLANHATPYCTTIDGDKKKGGGINHTPLQLTTHSICGTQALKRQA